MASDAPAMTPRQWALTVAMATLWGGSFLFYRVLAPEVPPFTLVLGRATLTALTLLGAFLALGTSIRPVFRQFGSFLVLAALTNAIPFSMLAWSERVLAAGTASIANAATPVLAVLAAAAFRVERLTAARLAGVLIGLGGVVVLVGPDAIDGRADRVVAELACVGASVLYAFGAIWARRVREVPPALIVLGQALGSIVWLVPLAAVAEHPWALPMPSPLAWASLAGIALLCTVLANGMYFAVLASAGPSNASLATLLVPVSALLLGWAALGEAPRPAALAGLGIIVMGLAVLDGRVVRRLRLRRPGAPLLDRAGAVTPKACLRHDRPRPRSVCLE